MVNSACVTWQGELLWQPADLPDAEVIDITGVKALGSWAHEWLRQRSQRRLVGAQPRIRRQLEAARVQVLWYQTLSEATARHGGVSPSERAMLWS